MSETKHKNFSGEFKAKVALEAIRGLRTVNEIGQDFGVHPTQVGLWKKELLEQAANVFDAKRGPKPADASTSSERFHSEIGRLKMELDWLKKSLGSANRNSQTMGRSQRAIGADPAMRTNLCSALCCLCAHKATKPDEQELTLLALIDAEYTRHPFYGSRKIKQYLHGLGLQGQPQAGAEADGYIGPCGHGAGAEHQSPPVTRSTRFIRTCSGACRWRIPTRYGAPTLRTFASREDLCTWWQ